MLVRIFLEGGGNNSSGVPGLPLARSVRKYLVSTNVFQLRSQQVRRRRHDNGYQYNDFNPIAQNKWIIKSLAGVLDVVQTLHVENGNYYHVSYSTLVFQAVTR